MLRIPAERDILLTPLDELKGLLAKLAEGAPAQGQGAAVKGEGLPEWMQILQAVQSPQDQRQASGQRPSWMLIGAASPDRHCLPASCPA